MTDQMKVWMEKDLEAYDKAIKQFQGKNRKKVPLWMLISIVCMVALGIAVGADAATIMRIHFPIGLVIAVFIWFCYWITTKTTSIKKVRKGYEKEIEAALNEQEQAAFCGQMESGAWEEVCYTSSYSNYPVRMLIGADYWFYSNGTGCSIIKTSEIALLKKDEQYAPVSVNVGGAKVRTNTSAGVILKVVYEKECQKEDTRLFFDKGQRVNEVLKIMERFCPQMEKWRMGIGSTV